MNIITPISEFNLNHIVFLESKQNLIIDGSFTKFIYSNNILSLNGIYLEFNLQLPIIDSSNINIFRPLKNEQLNDDLHDYIDKNKQVESFNLIQIEKSLLEYYKRYFNIDKPPLYILYNQLQNDIKSNNISKYLNKYPNKLYIKISGIWETETEIGITYKMIKGKII